MSEDLIVKPTPIQRNTLDVAIELTQLYYSANGIDEIEEIQNVFLKFYAVADYASKNSYKNFVEFLPEEIRKK